MHQFLATNREELIARCKRKVAQRPQRAATEQQLSHGVPLFLDQLTRTLAAESENEQDLSTRISGPSGPLSAFIADADAWARLDVNLFRCTFDVHAVDPSLTISGNREMLHAALVNILQNAFKFTQPDTVVVLMARADGNRVLISVADHCGGLPPNAAKRMFVPFATNAERMAGLGLGLSIARQSVEADMGTLTVQDVPGTGCDFTISLPRHSIH